MCVPPSWRALSTPEASTVSCARYGQRLSAREREMIGALCMGERSREIAERLVLSARTVDCHLQNARQKLGARTLYAAIYEYVTRYRSEV